MQTKLFEIRDRATFIPCIAILLNGFDHSLTDAERWLLRRAGYGDDCVLFGRLDGGGFCYDPYDFPPNPRTLRVAHDYISKHFYELESGAVVDVEFILDESQKPKTSERLDP